MAWGNAGWQRGLSDPFKDNLPRTVIACSVLEGEDDIG